MMREVCSGPELVHAGAAMDPQGGDPAGIDPLAQPAPEYIFDQRITW